MGMGNIVKSWATWDVVLKTFLACSVTSWLFFPREKTLAEILLLSYMGVTQHYARSSYSSTKVKVLSTCVTDCLNCIVWTEWLIKSRLCNCTLSDDKLDSGHCVRVSGFGAPRVISSLHSLVRTSAPTLRCGSRCN